MNGNDANNNIPDMINLFRYIYERVKIKKGEENIKLKRLLSIGNVWKNAKRK
jgi:hypothetical protein